MDETGEDYSYRWVFLGLMKLLDSASDVTHTTVTISGTKENGESVNDTLSSGTIGSLSQGHIISRRR